jgi:hypothetical protein
MGRSPAAGGHIIEFRLVEDRAGRCRCSPGMLPGRAKVIRPYLLRPRRSFIRINSHGLELI